MLIWELWIASNTFKFKTISKQQNLYLEQKYLQRRTPTSARACTSVADGRSKYWFYYHFAQYNDNDEVDEQQVDE